MWYEKVFMKYSAAFVAPVASRPDLNAYSGHFFWQGSYMETISNSYLTRQGKGPVLGLLQVWGKSMLTPGTVGTGRGLK